MAYYLLTDTARPTNFVRVVMSSTFGIGGATWPLFVVGFRQPGPDDRREMQEIVEAVLEHVLHH